MAFYVNAVRRPGYTDQQIVDALLAHSFVDQHAGFSEQEMQAARRGGSYRA